MTQWNFKGNYLLCISFLLVADRFIYKLSKFAQSHSSLNILLVQMSDICIAGAFLYRNGPDYRNELPEWTFTRILEYFSFCLLGQTCQECTQTRFSTRIM